MPKETIPYFAIASPYDIAYRKNSSPSPIGPHTHDATEIYLTHTPLPDVLINDTVAKAPAGSLIIIPPYCIHQLYHEAGIVYERRILSIHPEWLEQIFFADKSCFHYLKANSNPVILPLEEDSLSRITQCFADALATKCGESIDAICALFSLLMQIDDCVGANIPSDNAYFLNVSDAQKHVNELILYINEHLNENISLSELAEHFYLNVDYMSRLFKEHTHTSIGRYIAIQKITKAQMLLRENHSITQIQEMLGYSSYAHFAKTFKKLTGMTPGQYKGGR